MELKDFISETIKQIADGIWEGNSYLKTKSGSSEGIKSQYTKIDFDIAVSSNEQNKDDIGGKISVIQVFNARASTSKSASTYNENRIKFEVLAHIKTS